MFRKVKKLAKEITRLEERFADVTDAIAATEARHRVEIEALNARLAEAERQVARVGQLAAALKENTDFLPPPPMHLQQRVVGVYHPEFLDAGYTTASDLDGLLKPQGRSLAACHRILDWGCGCGRVLRALKQLYPDKELFGADIDEEAIRWLQQNYAAIATFTHNGPNPPIDLEGGTFDLIYGISVLTHLPEDMQFLWLEEVQRLLGPDGIAILSIHGPNTHAGQSESGKAQLAEKGFYYNDDAGETDGLPEFYKNAYHTYAYIHEEWGRYFDILSIEALAIQGLQDAVVVRKKQTA